MFSILTTKTKWTVYKREITLTGGGKLKAKALSTIEEALMSLFEEVIVEGHPDVAESGTGGEDNLDEENNFEDDVNFIVKFTNS